MRGTEYQKDLVLGPKKYNRWVGFYPIIAEFISDDIEALNDKKTRINEEDWNRIYEMSLEYVKKYPNQYRNGNPIYSDDVSKIYIRGSF